MAAPKGNNFARNAQVAKKALEHALLDYQGEEPSGERVSEFKALVDIWKAQIAKAVTDSDTQSAAMIVDRLDGKAKQQTEITGAGGGPVNIDFVVEFIAPENTSTS